MITTGEYPLTYTCKTTGKIWPGKKLDASSYKVLNPDTGVAERLGLAAFRKRFKSMKSNRGIYWRGK